MKLVSDPKAKVVLYYPILWMPQWPMWSPLCLYTLATALMHEGYEVVIIDERVDPDPRDWLVKEMQDALFVGIPGKMGGQCRNMEATAAFIKKTNPAVTVVAGGWFPSLFPDQTIISENIDIVTIGAADYSLPQIANHLLEGKSLEGIENVYFKENGRTVKNSVTRLPDIEDTKPIPWEVVGIKRYLHPHGWINYYSSRGCTGGCIFCSIYCLDPHRWTPLPAERVIDDLETLVRTIGARAFQILDTNFCADLNRVEKICRGLLERGLEVRFHVLGRHQELSKITDEQLSLFRKAGLTEIEVGLESGEQRIADLIHKQVDVDRFVDMVRRFNEAGIRIRVNTMLGIPQETRRDLVNTFDKMLQLKKLGPGVRFQMFRFTPLPDSPMGKQVLSMKLRGNEGRLPTTYRELLDFPVNDEPITMYWIPKKHERIVNRAYRFYAPLLFYVGVFDKAKGRPVWRAMLKLFEKLAKWRLSTGFFFFPFEIWLNRIFGHPMPMGADSGVVPPGDVLPMPEMGQALDDSPPLEPARPDTN